MNKEIKTILESDLPEKQKVEKLLEYDCALYTNLGKESTEKERENVKKQSKYIINRIVEIEPESKYLKTAFDR